MASNVPKFASFRPKPKVVAEPLKSEDREPGEEKSRTHAKPPPLPPAQKEREHVKSTSKAYFSDRRGDPANLRYGTLHASDIPAYRRFGHGYVLGLASSQRIDREETTSKSILITPIVRPRQERRLTDKQYNKSTRRALRLFRAGNETLDTESDYIALNNVLQNNGQRSSDDDDDDEQTMPTDYRSIQGKAKPSDLIDPDTHYEPDSMHEVDTQTTQRNAELRQQTQKDPHDLDGWKALAHHQKVLLNLDQPSTHLSASDQAHLAKSRISIYEDALKKNANNRTNTVALHRVLLREARIVWDQMKLDRRWQEVLAKYPENPVLWLDYLEFVQSSFIGFKFEHCRSIFLRSLTAICGAKAPNSTMIVHIILRYTCMASDAGYQELAIATWQALLEYTLMRPDAEADIGAFESFWESEAPRIGEPEAKGWKHHVDDAAVPPEPPVLSGNSSCTSLFDRFQAKEIDATAKLKLPGRTAHEVGEDDAFHTVLYSDIEDLVRLLPADLPSILTIDAFLLFMRLPSLPQLAMNEPRWRCDPFLQRQGQKTLHTPQGFRNSASAAYRHLSDCTVRSYRLTSTLLFQERFEIENTISADFLRRSLNLLLSETPIYEDIGEYLLAFETRHYPAEVRKTAKKLLKARPACQRLYNALGVIEADLGNPVKACQIFEMATSLKSEHRPWDLESLNLFWSWIWTTLRTENGFLESAGRVSDICQRSNLTNHTHMSQQDRFADAASIFRQMLEQYLLNAEHSSAVLCTSLLAILAYFSNQQDIEKALSMHQNFRIWLVSHKLINSPFAELQAQEIASLLLYHIEHAQIVKPALIRATLEPLISRFPYNTILLALYATNEMRFSIDNRVRDMLQQTFPMEADEINVAHWAFAVQFEASRGDTAGATQHTVRALFKRATYSTGAYCPAIWKSYVLFELDQVHESAAKAASMATRVTDKKNDWWRRLQEAKQRLKDTFFVGLQHTPWSKEYVMLALTELREAFNDEEKMKLYRIMQEKEMRLYIDIDEMDA